MAVSPTPTPTPTPAPPHGRLFDRSVRSKIVPVCSILLCWTLLLSACGALNLGKPLWIQTRPSDEHYWLLKDGRLSSGSNRVTKTAFDHHLNPVVNLWFTLANEKNKYVAESRWLDPAGDEFRTIRRTYDLNQEGKKSVSPRNKYEGTPRVHTISTQELYAHKPGLWKVALYIDGQLARRFEFSVR